MLLPVITSYSASKLSTTFSKGSKPDQSRKISIDEHKSLDITIVCNGVILHNITVLKLQIQKLLIKLFCRKSLINVTIKSYLKIFNN